MLFLRDGKRKEKGIAATQKDKPAVCAATGASSESQERKAHTIRQSLAQTNREAYTRFSKFTGVADARARLFFFASVDDDDRPFFYFRKGERERMSVGLNGA